MSSKRRHAAGALRTTAAIVALIASPSATLAGDDWRTFETEVGRFSIDMPGEPSEQRKEKWFPISSFASRVYKVFVGDDIFGVNHTDIPGFAMMFASHDTIFQSTREGFLEDSNATEVSYAETEVLGEPGRVLVYEIPAAGDTPPLHGTARMFFDDKRLYVFYAEVTDDCPPQDIERFLDSMRLLEQTK